MEKVLEFAEEFGDLQSEFYRLQEEEELQWEKDKIDRIEGGEKAGAIENPVFEYLDEFKSLQTVFKEKKNVALKEIKEVEKKNLEKKRTYIAALMDLIQNEENIGRAIGRFRDIQESWREVGDIPRDKRQEIQKEFSNLIDNFQYNINIYKDIKDHDLNRNLKKKKELIQKLKALIEIKKIKDVEQQLHKLQDEWTAIGGTHQSEWEKIKEDYWESVNAVYAKIRAFYIDRKVQQAKNIELKKGIIEKVVIINSSELKGHKDWKKGTDQIIKLQAEWKEIGYGPKEENNKVWKEFRIICDNFFSRKKTFYDGQNEFYDEIKEAKQKLIAEAEALKNSLEWKDTTLKIIALQKKWKEAGSAGPKNENKLWKKFRDPIDFFFAAKEAHFGAQDEANKENLKLKEALIKKIKTYKQKKDATKSIEDLRAFSKKFTEIGHVPKENKNDIYQAFKEAMDKQYEGLKIDKVEKERILFRAKLDSMLGSPNKDHLIQKEQTFIRSRIDKINKELNQYETNLAFFANADESNPLFKNVMQNINNSKSQVEGLKERLKMIRAADNE
ncbi:DUF349 domain-containing protein [Crocinitomix catalasitica]|nr:DUF349 domain-containing protein [Crocinitomix catalasitica]